MCTSFICLYKVCARLSYICTLYAQVFHISVYLMCTPFIYLYNVCGCRSNICILYAQALYISAYFTRKTLIYLVYRIYIYIYMHCMRMPVMHTYEHIFRVQCRHNISEQCTAIVLGSSHFIVLFLSVNDNCTTSYVDIQQ